MKDSRDAAWVTGRHFTGLLTSGTIIDEEFEIKDIDVSYHNENSFS